MATVPFTKKAELKPKHRRNLKKFAKLLHGLGVNVSEHVEKLELDENELIAIRAKFGKETFLKQKDRISLKLLLTKIFNIMRAFVKLEETLFNQVAPLTYFAYNKRLLAPDLIGLKAVRELHKGLYQRSATKLKADLPVARNFVLASIAQEHKTLFINYPKLLRAVENSVSELVDIEIRYADATHSAKEDFSELNKLLRKILHEDAYFITKDIARIYDIRADIYNWLVEADREVKPCIIPSAEREKEQLLSARNFYINTYKQHLQNIHQIYLGGVKI